MAQLTIREAAAALGVSQDTIRRRIKDGSLEAQREPMGSGYRWLVDLPEDLATEPQPAGDVAQGGASAAALELAEARARIAGLERLIDELASDRDHWREQAQRSQLMAETAQRLAEGAQALALPAGEPATGPEASAGTETPPRGVHGPSQPPEGVGARLRRWFTGE